MDYDLKISGNGILYHDFRPLRFCTIYQTILKPPLDRCQSCGKSLEVIDLTHEVKTMFLDVKGNIHETGTRKDDPVTAELDVATVIGEHGGHENRIVLHTINYEVTRCPHGV